MAQHKSVAINYLFRWEKLNSDVQETSSLNQVTFRLKFKVVPVMFIRLYHWTKDKTINPRDYQVLNTIYLMMAEELCGN